MYLPIVCTMLAIAVDGPAPAAEVFSILSLEPRQSLVVRYQSVGCFHHFVYTFEFTGSVVVIHDLGVGAPGHKGKRLGCFTLDDDDLVKLDRLLAYYAGRPRGRCTTVDTVRVVVKDGPHRVRCACYVDGSCTTSDLPGMLSLNRLACRLLKDWKN